MGRKYGRTVCLLLTAFGPLLLVPVLGGCGGGDGNPGGGGGDGNNPGVDIGLADTGHMHAFREYTLNWAVSEVGAALAGLTPIVSYRHESSETGRETAEGDVVDNGDGTYSWTRTFSDAGVWILTFMVAHEGHDYAQCFSVEVSKAGGESIYCPSQNNPDHNYQIRWEVSPGHIHAPGDVTFSIELKRSINTPVNTQQPWQNVHDHLSPTDLVPAGSLPTIAVGSAAGEEALQVTYRGQGIYEATHSFGHVSDRTTHWLHVTFTDDCGTIDESGENDANYQFPVVPAH